MNWQALESAAHYTEVSDGMVCYLVIPPLSDMQISQKEGVQYVREMKEAGYRLEYYHRQYGCYIRALSRDGRVLE